jgi:small subunit ribosomal protein S16
MVKIRLHRMGRRNRPIYRVVVVDSRSPRDGKSIDIIGHYNPLTDPATISIDEEKALKWLRHGAQPTDTVRSLLGKVGIMDKVKPTSGQN